MRSPAEPTEESGREPRFRGTLPPPSSRLDDGRRSRRSPSPPLLRPGSPGLYEPFEDGTSVKRETSVLLTDLGLAEDEWLSDGENTGTFIQEDNLSEVELGVREAIPADIPQGELPGLGKFDGPLPSEGNRGSPIWKGLLYQWTVPFTAIAITPNVCAIALLILLYGALYAKREEFEEEKIPPHDWVLCGIILWVAFIVFYFVIGFIIWVCVKVIPHRKTTFFLLGLRHPTALLGWGIVGFIFSRTILEDADEDLHDLVDSFFISVMVVAGTLGVRMVFERHVQLKLAKEKYFERLSSAVFKEKVLFKVLMVAAELDVDLQTGRAHDVVVNDRDAEMRTFGVDHGSRPSSDREGQGQNHYRSRVRSIFNRNKRTPRFSHGQLQGLWDDWKTSLNSRVDSSVARTRTKWWSPLERGHAPDTVLLGVIDEYASYRKPKFLAHQRQRDTRAKLSSRGADELNEKYIQLACRAVWCVLRNDQSLCTLESFERVYPGPDKAKRRRAAFAVFAGDESLSSLPEAKVHEAVRKIFVVRRNLSKGLSNRADIVRVLRIFMNVFYWSLMFVIILVIFGVDFLAVFVPYLSVSLSFSFMFGGVAADFLESGLMIIMNHPYDVGDRITVGGETFIVDRINLMRTTCYTPANKYVQLRNSTLAKSHITNWHRSGEYVVEVEVMVDARTPGVVIAAIFKRVREYCDKVPLFRPDPIVQLMSMDEANGISLYMWIDCKEITWSQTLLRLEARARFLDFLHSTLAKFNVIYSLPQQPVVMLK